MKILLDLDNTVNMFDENFVVFVRKEGYEFDTSNFNNREWDMSSYIRGSDNPKKVMEDIFMTAEFWLTIEPVPFAFEVLKDLYRKHEIVISTMVWKEGMKHEILKKHWIDKNFHFLRNNKFVFNPKKWEIEGDVIIDDKPRHLEKSQGSKITICSDRPYNREVKSDYRFSSWKEMPKIIKEIERRI